MVPTSRAFFCAATPRVFRFIFGVPFPALPLECLECFSIRRHGIPLPNFSEYHVSTNAKRGKYSACKRGVGREPSFVTYPIAIIRNGEGGQSPRADPSIQRWHLLGQMLGQTAILKNRPHGLPRPACIETSDEYPVRARGQWPTASWRYLPRQKTWPRGSCGPICGGAFG